VRFATSAALAIGAVSCAIAWTFAGEVALGQWGVAACAAAAAFIAPGPPVVGAVLGIAVGAGLGLVLAELGRRQSALATAMAGVALSVGAPYALLRLGTPSWNLDVDLVAPAAGGAAALVAVAGVWLRGRRLGIAMVAARDERRRAAGLGVDVTAARRVAMALSGATAGLAGVVYLASVPAGVAPDAFAATRSLDVMAFAVVGGLGSTVGAALGAAVLLWASLVLPPPWGAVASGAGVLWVVLLMPAGLTALLTQFRDAAIRPLTREGRSAIAAPPDDLSATPTAPVDRQASVAGADTREAAATPTVRALAVTAWLLSAPALVGFFGTPHLLRDHFRVDLGAAAAWVLVLLAGLAAVAAWAGLRSRAHPPVIAIAMTVMSAGVFVATSDGPMLAGVAVVSPIFASWAVARLVATSRRVVIPQVRSAAAGIIVASSLAGAVGGAHLAVVAASGDLLDAARWAVLYAAAAAAAAISASRHVDADVARVRARVGDDAQRRSLGRLRWAPLRVDDLVVDFGASRVLDGVELDVAPGSVLALVGANGSGKSTLLRTVAGFVDGTRGRVAVTGHDITGLQPNERANLGVAFVDGARPIFPDLTVRENLRVGAYLTHRTRRSFEAALAHVLAVVPVLSTRLDTPAGALSGGEQRHLAVAQTLFRRPTVLLADELTLGLDRGSQGAVRGLLRTLADDGIAVVVVDHDLDAVLAIADHVALVDDGSIVASASAGEFASSSRHVIEARFLATAAP